MASPTRRASFPDFGHELMCKIGTFKTDLSDIHTQIGTNSQELEQVHQEIQDWISNMISSRLAEESQKLHNIQEEFEEMWKNITYAHHILHMKIPEKPEAGSFRERIELLSKVSHDASELLSKRRHEMEKRLKVLLHLWKLLDKPILADFHKIGDDLSETRYQAIEEYIQIEENQVKNNLTILEHLRQEMLHMYNSMNFFNESTEIPPSQIQPLLVQIPKIDIQQLDIDLRDSNFDAIGYSEGAISRVEARKSAISSLNNHRQSLATPRLRAIEDYWRKLEVDVAQREKWVVSIRQIGVISLVSLTAIENEYIQLQKKWNGSLDQSITKQRESIQQYWTSNLQYPIEYLQQLAGDLLTCEIYDTLYDELGELYEGILRAEETRMTYLPKFRKMQEIIASDVPVRKYTINSGLLLKNVATLPARQTDLLRCAIEFQQACGFPLILDGITIIPFLINRFQSKNVPVPEIPSRILDIFYPDDGQSEINNELNHQQQQHHQQQSAQRSRFASTASSNALTVNMSSTSGSGSGSGSSTTRMGRSTAISRSGSRANSRTNSSTSTRSNSTNPPRSGAPSPANSHNNNITGSTLSSTRRFTGGPLTSRSTSNSMINTNNGFTQSQSQLQSQSQSHSMIGTPRNGVSRKRANSPIPNQSDIGSVASRPKVCRGARM